MEEYKPNSHLSKQDIGQPEKKVEKVTTSPVKLKKKSEAAKIAGSIIQENSRNVVNYLFLDVFVPAMKKLVTELVSNGLDMLLYGEGGKSKSKSQSSRISYRSYYDDPLQEKRRSIGYGSMYSTGYDFDEVIFPNRGEAEEVLCKMMEIIEGPYGSVSVLDLYDLVGVSGSRYTDAKYGWTDLRNTSIARVREGYILRLPKAVPLDR